MDHKLKSQLINGTFWTFVGKISYMFISLVTNIILARIIGPKAFGQVGIVMFFILLAKTFMESGLSGALIRKTKVFEEDYSTVFIFNFVASIVLFLAFYFSASFISEFYNDQNLKNLLIIASFVLVINAFQIVNNVKLVRSLNFKLKSIIEFISVTIASIVSIILVTIFNFGVWAVIIFHLIFGLAMTVQLLYHFGNIPKLTFDKRSFEGLYKFGVNTTLASILNTAFDNIYQLILGKFFNVTQTGLYYQAKKLQEVPVNVLKSTTSGVIFANLSKIQEDKRQFQDSYSQILTVFSIILSLISIFLFFYAKEIIMLLYGAEWLESVFYMKILTVSSFFFIQEVFNRNIFKVFNRTEKILSLEILKKVIQSMTIIIGIRYRNIDILIFGILFTSFISYFINYYFSKRVLSSHYWNEIKIVLKIFLISSIVILIGSILKQLFSVDGYNSFFIFPFLLLLYIGLISLFQITNMISGIKNLISDLCHKDLRE